MCEEGEKGEICCDSHIYSLSNKILIVVTSTSREYRKKTHCR